MMIIPPRPRSLRFPASAALLLAFALAGAAPAWAQGEQSGQVEQSLKKSEEEKRLEKELPQINVQDRPELKSKDDTKVRLKLNRIRITGNKAISTDELQPLVAPWEGRDLTLADLKAAANRITLHYRAQGYQLSWAYVPEQVVKDGDIEIAVVEGRVDRVLVTGNEHYSTNFILDHVVGVQDQDSLDLDTLERGLLSLNDYPGISVTAKLAPGGGPGTSDLTLTVADKYPVNVAVDYDNFGSESVTEDRVGLTIETFNLFELGHWISVRAVTGFGEGELAYLTGSYTAPLPNGLKATVYGSFYDYEAGGEVAIFEPLGDGTIFGGTLSYPIVRNREWSVIPEVGYEHKDLTQDILGTQISEDRLRVLIAGVRFEWNDDFDGRWVGSAHMRFGLDGFADGLESEDPNASRQGAGGDFTKGTVIVYRLQKVTSWLHFIGRVNYQFSADPVVVSEQIAIGGPDSVRGYPPFEFMGDRGYTASIEARIKLPFLDSIWDPWNDQRTLFDMIQLAVFADTGEGELENPGLGEDDRLRLSGAGVGLRFQYPGRVTARLDVGWPVTDEEPSTGDEPTIYFSIIMNLF